MKKSIKPAPFYLSYLLKNIHSFSDAKTYMLIFKKLIRLYIAIKTGNTKLWSTIKNEESKNFDLITKSFEDQKALDAVKNKLKNP